MRKPQSLAAKGLCGRAFFLAMCLALSGCAGSPLRLSMMTAEEIQSADSNDLCRAYLLIREGDNPLNLATTNITNEVMRRALSCTDYGTGETIALMGDGYKDLNRAPDELLNDFKSGKIVLDCDNHCGNSWERAANELYSFDMAENWKTLALRVSQIGRRYDLAYYYLGQAAQGLGYHTTAIKYYTLSAAIASGGSPGERCGSYASGCFGIDIPEAVPVLIQASENILNVKRTSRGKRRPKRT